MHRPGSGPEHFDVHGVRRAMRMFTAFYKLGGWDERTSMLRFFMQSLLQDRFQLKGEYRDARPARVCTCCRQGRNQDEGSDTGSELTPGIAPAPGARFTGFSSPEPNVYRAGDYTMTDFTKSAVDLLPDLEAEQVVDETGLKESLRHAGRCFNENASRRRCQCIGNAGAAGLALRGAAGAVGIEAALR